MLTVPLFQMLNCILGMVDKTKKALGILQQRQLGHSLNNIEGENAAAPAAQPQPQQQRRQQPAASPQLRPQQALGASSSGATANMNDILAATIRSTEERVVEVRRRAEEAVQEVKRTAMAELQKAVAMAERRAVESVASERLKMERLILESAVSASAVASVAGAVPAAVSKDMLELSSSQVRCIFLIEHTHAAT